MLEGAQELAGAVVPVRRRRARELVAAHPVAAWLSGLIALSAVVRLALAYWIPVPWIYADELTYSELAKNFGSSGSFAIRDVHGLGYGPLYPLLISPAYAAFESVPHAYLAAKAINSLAMSAAAVPAYFLARRLVSRSWAIAAAGLTLAVPGLVYTGMLMTENLFYPLFLVVVLGMVRALERPSVGRQLAALALIALALLTRPQAVALVAALVTAMVALAVIDAESPRSLLRRLGAYAPTWLALAGGLGALAGWEALHHRSLSASFGNAAVVWHEGYSVPSVARWFLYHLAELDLYTGVLPFAAFLLLAGLAFTRGERSVRIFAVVSLATTFWLLVVVSAFVSNLTRYDPHTSSHIMDRYTFYLVPLMLIALVAWSDNRLMRPPWVIAVAGLVAGILPLAVPYGRFIRSDAIPDTFGLLPWAVTQGSVLAPRAHVTAQIAFVALALGGLFFLLRHARMRCLIPPLVLLNFIAVFGAAQVRTHGASAAAANSIQSNLNWIDKAVGPNTEVIAIWSGRVNPHVIWENEFFNRSVGSIYYLRAPDWQGLPTQPVRIGPGGAVRIDGTNDPLRARYVLVDSSLAIRGKIVAADAAGGMRVYRLPRAGAAGREPAVVALGP